MMDLSIEELDWIPQECRVKMRGVGVATLLDLALSPLRLLEEAGIPEAVAGGLVAEAVALTRSFVTGREVLQMGEGRGRVSTSSPSIDRLLGGGVRTGLTTEFFGAQGTGKTQLCFQLSVNTQLPPSQGGLEGSVLFVDTVGTFRPERIVQMSRGRGEGVLEGIMVVGARSVGEQLGILERLDEVPVKRPLKMLIIDTVTDNFLYEYDGEENLIRRQSILARHLHDLRHTALERDMAVVLTNTVRQRLKGDLSWEEEAGGVTMSQGVHVRLHLFRGEGGWRAELVDYRERIRSAQFTIDRGGISDYT